MAAERPGPGGALSLSNSRVLGVRCVFAITEEVSDRPQLFGTAGSGVDERSWGVRGGKCRLYARNAEMTLGAFADGSTCQATFN